MSDERFDRIERWQTRADERFDRIDRVLDRIEGRMGGLDGRMGGLDGRMDGLEGRMDGLEGRMDTFDGRMDRLETGQRELGDRIETLDDGMHALHEDVVAKIRAVAEFATIVDERMDRRFTEVKEAIAREVDPMKLAIRHHSSEIDRRKKRGG